ncbi:MAG TPA: hypothetical protein VMW17_05230 [Candidatus Binatia bacterium]|nr:hypothetical protein [Candidatus Binatia bacterium]
MNRFSVIERLIRALLLDRGVYDAVASERVGLSQAIGVVLLAGISTGASLHALPGTIGALFGILVSVVGWVTLSVLTYVIGRWVVRGGPSSMRAVAACLGFADAPAVFNLMAVIPRVGGLVRVIVWFWLLATTMVAAQSAFRTSRARGAAIGGLAFAAYLFVGVLVGIWSS